MTEKQGKAAERNARRSRRSSPRPNGTPCVPATFLHSWLLESISDLIAYQDAHSQVLWANKVAADSVGAQPEDLVGRACYEIWHRRRDVCPGCPVVRARETGQPQAGEISSPDGRSWLIRGFPVRGDDGTLVGVVEITTDITERVQLEAAQREVKERLRTLFDTARDGISITNESGRFLEVNQAMSELFGYSRDEFAALTASDLYVNPEDRDRLRRSLRATSAVQGYEVNLRRKDGRILLCSLTTAAHRPRPDADLLYYTIIRDVTRDREQEAQLLYLSTHDPLTGLANRASLLDRLELEIARARRSGESIAVLYMDLHGLKKVNDEVGHAGGDTVLKEVAERLRAALRASDTLGRLGGDEFVLVAPDADSPSDAAAVASRVVEVFHAPYLVAGQEFTVTVSVGIAICRRDGLTGNELLRRADAAMYVAKSQGPNRFSFCS